MIISIHARREEGDALLLYSSNSLVRFLSTPSARRATAKGTKAQLVGLFLSTPSARRATYYSLFSYNDKNISIHALREEGDKKTRQRSRAKSNFYPRPPRGGRHPRLLPVLPCPVISIHALREEGDTSTLWSSSCSRYFYPRPPRGGRQSASALEPPE